MYTVVMIDAINDIIGLLLFFLFDTRYNWVVFGSLVALSLFCALSLIGLRSFEKQEDENEDEDH